MNKKETEGLRRSYNRDQEKPIIERSDLNLLIGLLSTVHTEDPEGKALKLMDYVQGNMEQLLYLKPEEISEFLTKEESEIIPIAKEILKRCMTYSRDLDCLDTKEKQNAFLRNLTKEMSGLGVEQVKAIYFNNKVQKIGERILSTGDSKHTVVSDELIFSEAFRIRAGSVIIAHNHPDGKAKPSPEDMNVFVETFMTSVLVKFPIMDFVVIGEGKYWSVVAHGVMDQIFELTKRNFTALGVELTAPKGSVTYEPDWCGDNPVI